MSTRASSRVERFPSGLGFPFSTAERMDDSWEVSVRVGPVRRIDNRDDKVVSGAVAADIKQALENIRAVLDSVGRSMDQVIKVSVFLPATANLAAVNKACAVFQDANSYAVRRVGLGG